MNIYRILAIVMLCVGAVSAVAFIGGRNRSLSSAITIILFFLAAWFFFRQ